MPLPQIPSIFSSGLGAPKTSASSAETDGFFEVNKTLGGGGVVLNVGSGSASATTVPASIKVADGIENVITNPFVLATIAVVVIIALRK